MDRFIAQLYSPAEAYENTLKSNMDRFIENADNSDFGLPITLKSNMDRFIAGDFCYCS